MEDISEEFDEGFVFEPDFNPSSEFWSIYLTLPRPSKLSDEQMEVYFQRRDGRWSRQTKTAITHHKAGGLDLNDNWALTRQDWYCPACGRSKNEIFRLSKRSILLAKLELHHDHMADFVWPRAEVLLGQDWRGSALPGSGEILSSIRDLTVRFKNFLICSECNSADGKVKLRYQDDIDSRFSFTAAEIARFIRPQAHSDHGIDFDEASKIWKSAREGFQTRLKLVDQLLTDLRDGHLVREGQGALGARPMWTMMSSAEMLSEAFRLEAKDSERDRLLSSLPSEFLARSTSCDSATLPRQVASTNPSGPTDAEFANYIDPVSTKRWQATSSDWKCPLCERSKRQILRRSNKGKWSGGVREHIEYLEETDTDIIEKRMWLFPDFRNDYWLASTQTTHICSDCSGVGTQVVQGNRSLGEPYLTLQDIQDCIVECRPHRRHEIDIDVVRQRIAQNDAYLSAAAALSAYNNLVSKFHQKMEWCSKGGTPRSEIFADLCEELAVYNQITDTAQQEELVTFILKQRERSANNG